MSDKEIRADAKLKNLPEEALEDLWRFRNPEEGGEKLTLEAIAVEIPLRYGFTVSISTLSGFYAWLRLKRRMDSAAERAMQAKLELAKDPSVTPEDLERAAQTIFTAETLEDGNVKGYVQLARLGLQRKALDIDLRRLAILERKAKAADEAAEQMRLLKAGGKMMPEDQRAAILDKMDEILGLKK